jgi:hypothetical protein
VQPSPLSSAARLEEIHCLLAANRLPEATLKAEALLQDTPLVLRGEVHFLCGEALADSYRPEEAVWHYVQALLAGEPATDIMPRLRALCGRTPFPEPTVLSVLQELWSNGRDDEALDLAEGVVNRPEYAGVRQWALGRAKARGGE